MMCFDVLMFLQLKDTTVSIGLVFDSGTCVVFCEYVGAMSCPGRACLFLKNALVCFFWYSAGFPDSKI